MISVCLLTKNENKYLKEWIEYHRGIGIDHFYIYDNNDDLSISDEIYEYCDKKNVTVTPWLTYCNHMQIEAYNDCLQKFGQENEWIAFIDTDEFIHCDNISNMLEKYQQYDYIRIPWVMYNANGHLKYEDVPVRDRFKTTMECPSIYKNYAYKSIVRPSKIKHMDVHSPSLCYDNYILASDITLDHYYTRSLEEWTEKIFRGSCSPQALKRYDEFFVYNQDLLPYKNDNLMAMHQEYINCKKTIDIKIMAHKSRRDNVLKILKQLNMDESIVVYDDRENGGDALYTARKAWLSPIGGDKTHRLVLQDDVLLCDNFINIVHDIINTIPDKVVSLFNLVPYELRNPDCCYKKFQTLSGVAIIMPVMYIKKCWQWIDENYGDCKCDDLMIAKYCKQHEIDMFTTIPTVVQHIGDSVYQSLLSVRYLQPRISPTYKQHPTEDFTVFSVERTKMQKFKAEVRRRRALRILNKKE